MSFPCVCCVCGVQGQLRWIVAQKNRVRNGELYRFIADSKGAFVQVSQSSPAPGCLLLAMDAATHV